MDSCGYSGVYYQNMTSLELEARLDNLLATAQEETKDVDLFAPVPEREECPICLIPLPLTERQVVFMRCCGKCICAGCRYKQSMTDKDKKGANHSLKDSKCPFCQQKDKNNAIKSLRKLMKKKNPRAFIEMARYYHLGDMGLIQSNTRALEMYICAAELGHAEAFVNIGCRYEEGTVVEQNLSKTLEYYEVAAKKGSLSAHRFLLMFHGTNGDIQTSIRHIKVAASAGDQESMDDLMKTYKGKLISKEELTQTLRAFQTSKDLTKSKDREDIHALIDQYLY